MMHAVFRGRRRRALTTCWRIAVTECHPIGVFGAGQRQFVNLVRSGSRSRGACQACGHAGNDRSLASRMPETRSSHFLIQVQQLRCIITFAARHGARGILTPSGWVVQHDTSRSPVGCKRFGTQLYGCSVSLGKASKTSLDCRTVFYVVISE